MYKKLRIFTNTSKLTYLRVDFLLLFLFREVKKNALKISTKLADDTVFQRLIYQKETVDVAGLQSKLSI